MDAIAIAGASLAGIRAARTLREEGFGGRLSLIGDEPHLPYNRPPLSKEMLADEWDEERILLEPRSAIDGLDVDLRLGIAATELDLPRKSVALSDGSRLDFDGLVIATGARPRQLPGTSGMRGIFALRTLDDARELRAALRHHPGRVVVVGAGFIGAEVASSARQLGLDVTVLEFAPIPFENALGARMGTVLADLQRGYGIDLRTGVGVAGVDGLDRVERVQLTDGGTLDAELLVVGIGVVPNTEWLVGSGLTIDNGVVCDATCLAAPGVVAAGDIARWPNPAFDDELMRVEHWDNANEQGVHAAKTLLRGPEGAEPYAPIPWFWSDQCDSTIQMAGRPRRDDKTQVISGTVGDGKFAVIYGRGDRVVAVFGVNEPRQVIRFRRLIAQATSWSDALAVAGE